jgi:hypothetical protein
MHGKLPRRHGRMLGKRCQVALLGVAGGDYYAENEHSAPKIYF